MPVNKEGHNKFSMKCKNCAYYSLLHVKMVAGFSPLQLPNCDAWGGGGGLGLQALGWELPGD